MAHPRRTLLTDEVNCVVSARVSRVRVEGERCPAPSRS